MVHTSGMVASVVACDLTFEDSPLTRWSTSTRHGTCYECSKSTSRAAVNRLAEVSIDPVDGSSALLAERKAYGLRAGLDGYSLVGRYPRERKGVKVFVIRSS